MDRLREILKVNRMWDVVIVGIGDMGHALARYGGFGERGFQVSLLFDSDPAKIGQKVGNFAIEDVAQLVDRVRTCRIRLAMVAVPAAAAQEVADKLVQAGVRAILNYAPSILSVPENVHVQHIDPSTHL